MDFIIKLVTTLFQIRACVIMHAQQNILTSQQFHFTVFTYMYSHVPPQTIILCIQCTVSLSYFINYIIKDCDVGNIICTINFSNTCYTSGLLTAKPYVLF